MKIEDWQICGTMGTKNNTTAETTVDATFRVVEAINISMGLNNISYDDIAKTLTFTTTATLTKLLTSMYVSFEGSTKIFEFALFNNGIETPLVVNDRAGESLSVTPILELPAGTHTFDVRQRSIDGGVNLTINHIGITFARIV